MINYIIIFILISSKILFANSDIINDLKKLTETDENDKIIVFYFEMVSCVKCYIEPMEIIKHLQENKKLESYKIVAVVVCDRDIELKIFKKEQNWKFNMYRNDGTVKSKLGAGADTFITLISPNHKVQNLKPGNLKNNYKIIIDFLTNGN